MGHVSMGKFRPLREDMQDGSWRRALGWPRKDEAWWLSGQPLAQLDSAIPPRTLAFREAGMSGRETFCWWKTEVGRNVFPREDNSISRNSGKMPGAVAERLPARQSISSQMGYIDNSDRLQKDSGNANSR